VNASAVARRHFDAAMREAEVQKLGQDNVARQILSLVVRKYLETRSVADIQSELNFVADNCDPDTDYMFMRP
jgi:hypothetical protein